MTARNIFCIGLRIVGQEGVIFGRGGVEDAPFIIHEAVGQLHRDDDRMPFGQGPAHRDVFVHRSAVEQPSPFPDPILAGQLALGTAGLPRAAVCVIRKRCQRRDPIPRKQAQRVTHAAAAVAVVVIDLIVDEGGRKGLAAACRLSRCGGKDGAGCIGGGPAYARALLSLIAGMRRKGFEGCLPRQGRKIAARQRGRFRRGGKGRFIKHGPKLLRRGGETQDQGYKARKPERSDHRHRPSFNA
ncbi:MAG: hypothetical protein PHX82_06980 [Paracoccaceae bacterium]|nr:hypothetical protein [Paracoccaceae bacterium]